MKQSKGYVIVFNVGGTARPVWKHTLVTGTPYKMLREVKYQQGYDAFISTWGCAKAFCFMMSLITKRNQTKRDGEIICRLERWLVAKHHQMDSATKEIIKYD